MEEGKPLAKDLRFVILLDPQSLSCVDRSETLLQFAQDILVHGIISLRKSARSSMRASASARHYRVFSSAKQLVSPSNIAHLHLRCETARDLTPNRLPTVTLVGRTINSSIQCVAVRRLGSDLDADRTSDTEPNNTLSMPVSVWPCWWPPCTPLQ
jgi:hypothetical protein